MTETITIEKQLRAEAKACQSAHFIDLLTRAAGIIELQRMHIAELEQKAIKANFTYATAVGQWLSAVDDLELERRNHKSVIDSIKGLSHAWYCESQLAGGECNCGKKASGK